MKKLPARMYVSVPDSGKVYMYNTSSLRSDPEPVRTLVVKQLEGYRDPEPGALAADEKGQLAVVDVANNAVHFYNGPEDYWYYRTLGHPPNPASDRGFLDHPAAFANAAGSFKLGFWVADSGNGRIQHWDPIGTTDWMSDAMAPGDPTGPVNVTLPEVDGRVAVDSELTCDLGTWDGSPSSYAVSWLRDGVPVGSAQTTYTVRSADVGSELRCVVIASTADGAASAPATSEVFAIPGPSSPPYILEKPAIQGNVRSGAVVRCTTGSWTDEDPTSYLWGWLRDGQPLPGTNAREFLVTDSDISHEITCRVAAVNAHGTGKAALSDPIVAEAGSGSDGGGGIDAPLNQRRPEIVGQAAVGAVLYCDPGLWENAPTFSYVWQRDGVALGGSETDQYEVVGDDEGAQLTCVVTGTNPGGSDSATAKPVTPHGSVSPGSSGGGSTSCTGTAAVSIDGGAKYAHDPYVVLKIRVPKTATGVTISNDARFKHADTRPLAPSCRYKWTLPKTTSHKPKVVHVRFLGATGSRATDSVVLDSSAPELHEVSARWRTSWWSWVVTIRAGDHGTGLWKVQVGSSKHSTRWVKWGHPVNDADSSHLRWLRVWDRAGNHSDWYRLRL